MTHSIVHCSTCPPVGRSPATHPPVARPRVGGALRWACRALLANVMVTAVGLPLARASAEKRLERAGTTLLDSLGPALVGPPQVVSLNGQRLYLASRVTSLTVPEVLDALERHCQGATPGASSERGGWLAALDGHEPSGESAERWRSVRHAEPNGHVGQLACFARSPHGNPGRLASVLDFLRSLDLSSLGAARYVVARSDPASGATHVLTLWTDGTFDVPALFPIREDAPGGDSKLAPRPPGSRRILSARILDRPYALHLYTSPEAPPRVLEGYAREMVTRGFSSTDLPADASDHATLGESRAFMKGGAVVLVVARPGRNEQTEVSLVELGALARAGSAEEAR